MTTGGQERVSFKGQVAPDEISFWLNKTDVLVMTSKSEGRPNAVLEALAAGVPVVGSDIPGIRELVVPGVNGRLFPYDDYKALATSLLPFKDRALRVRLGEGGRQFIVEHGLSWEHTAEKYLHEFQKNLQKEKYLICVE